MKRSLFTLIAAALCGSLLVACTENARARSFGGVWVITRSMRPDEKPETFTMKEHSGLGIVEGTVLINEKAVKTEP